MNSSLRVGLGLIAVSSLFAFVACGDDDDSPTPSAHAGTGNGGGGGEGATAHGGDGHSGEGHGGAAALALECKVIGTLCHEADTGSGTGHDCHELGHEGHVDECAEQFDACITFCTAEETGTGGAPAEPKDAHCAALGELCHAVDDETGPLHECHELGHVGNAAKCAEGFDECAALCLAAREALPHTPAGGAGGGAGVGAGGVNAGGASLGGAGGAQ